MPPAENMPDFDSMSPEEVMAWMESLAKRQGASEGFTTSADIDIPEVDPESVVIDEPGYVPYGQEKSAAQPIQSAPSVVEQPAAQQQPSTAEPAAPEPRRIEPVRVERPAPPEPEAAPPVRQPEPEPLSTRQPAASNEDSTLAWLESLAADQTEDLFNLDLTTLPLDDNPTPIPIAPERANPLSWLESLTVAGTESDTVLDILPEDDEEPSEKVTPFGTGVDPMEWMETLAKRQGADPDELTTAASLNVPTPPEDAVEGVEYQPFSFDNYPVARPAPPPEPAALENPADFLRELAAEQGYGDGEHAEQGVIAVRSDDFSMEAILAAIADGTVSREQMQVYLEQQSLEAQKVGSLADVDYDELDAEEPLAPAEMPDWMRDLMPQDEPAVPPTPTAPLESIFEQPMVPVTDDMPDWLREDEIDGDTLDLESIFIDQEAEAAQSPALELEDEDDLAFVLETDADDPWAEAFDLEQSHGMDDINTMPDWYARNVRDPQRIADIERMAGITEGESPLIDAPLPPENDLVAGQPAPVPTWMSELLPQPAAPAFTPTESPVFEDVAEPVTDMPDWLREVEASQPSDEVPDWLREALPADEAEVVTLDDIFEPEPEPAPLIAAVPPTPAPPRVPAPQPQQQPAPARTFSDSAEVLAALEAARDREQSGDLEGSLEEYEQLIRANAYVEAVVADLQQLVKSYKSVPALYRVLGDGLMRQGKLQAALDTYREALNQL